MKVVAAKDIEAYGQWWEVRYTRLTRRGVKQDAYLVCNTHEQARQKYQELLDALMQHDGVYVSTKAKRKAHAKRRRSAKREVVERSGLVYSLIGHRIGYSTHRRCPDAYTRDVPRGPLARSSQSD